MNDVKQRAIDTMDELHQTIEYCQYSTVMDGLLDIEPLQERDEALEELWSQFSDVPMNPETERTKFARGGRESQRITQEGSGRQGAALRGGFRFDLAKRDAGGDRTWDNCYWPAPERDSGRVDPCVGGARKKYEVCTCSERA